jgi:hypothetical protein
MELLGTMNLPRAITGYQCEEFSKLSFQLKEIVDEWSHHKLKKSISLRSSTSEYEDELDEING